MIDSFFAEAKEAIRSTRFDSVVYSYPDRIETQRAIFKIDEDGITIFDRNQEQLHPRPLQMQEEVEAVLSYHWS